MRRIIALGFIMVFIACSGHGVKIELSREERDIADSIYIIKRKRLDSILDSLCTTRYDSIYNMMYDSILNERLKTIHKLYTDEKK